MLEKGLATCEKCGEIFAQQSKDDKLCWLCKNSKTICKDGLQKGKNVKKDKKFYL